MVLGNKKKYQNMRILKTFQIHITTAKSLERPKRTQKTQETPESQNT